MQQFRPSNLSLSPYQSKTLCLMFVCLGISLWAFARISLAQSSLSEDYWQRIQRADAQLQASQLTWKQIMDEHPNPAFSQNPQEALAQQLARATADAQKLGMTPDQTQSHLQKTRELFELLAKGFSQTRLLKVLHDDKSTRCDVVQTDGTYFSIDFFDGLNCVSLFEFYVEKQNDKTLPNVRPDAGSLSRDQKDKLAHSAPRTGDYLFFVDGRITQSFSPANSVLRDVSPQFLELERPESSDPHSHLLRLMISKKSMRPWRLDYVNRSNGKTYLRYEVETYRDYPGANQFPYQVNFTVYSHGANGTQIMASEKCTLLKAEFNDAADLTELRVPPGTNLDDYRFGQQNSVTYTLGPKGTLPVDEKVRALLEKQGRFIKGVEEKSNVASIDGNPTQTSGNSSAPTNISSTAPLALGALLILGGCLLWGRSGSDKENKV